MLVPYVFINAARLVMLVVATAAFGLNGSQLEAAWRGAGALFAVGMLSWSVFAYLVDQGPRAVVYGLRWLLPPIVFIAFFFYDPETTPSEA